MKRPRLGAEDFTVGWVCALPVERAAAEQLLDEQYEDTQDWCDGPFILGRMGHYNIVISCLPAGSMGTNPAAVIATKMDATFPSLKIRMMVGIGGGVPSAETDIRLGDVVISQPIKGYGGVVQYDFGKAGADGRLERTGFLNAPPRILLDAVTDLRSRLLRGTSQVWKHLATFDTRPIFTRAQAGSDVLFPAEKQHVRGSTCDHCDQEMAIARPQRDENTPHIYYGTVASGNQVVKDAVTRDRWSTELGGVLCFEMEAAGLMNHFPCLIIRGICDYADSHKNKSWQPYAAATAAACAKEILSSIPEADRSKSDRSTAGLKSPSNLPNAKDAPFNAVSKQHEPECLPDTRTDLLQEIYSWVDGQDERCIFWLEGLAGTGKSTISRTVARKFFDQGRLAASFFFSRGGGDVGRADKFVSSITVQLADSIPALREHICDALMERPKIFDLALRDQWKWLVVDPLAKLDADDYRLPYILVVDALDECENDNDIRIIVQLLSEARALETVRMRVFLTSRPETPIRSGFRQIPTGGYHDFVLHNISLPIVDRDISKFFWHELTLINQELVLDTGWPGEEIVRALVHKASGLFIWASTACRFIRDGVSPQDSLDEILEGSTTTETPEEHLNGIYLTILQKATQRCREREKSKLHQFLRDILGTVVTLFSPLPVAALSSLLFLKLATANTTLSHLHAILNIPTQQTEVLRLHHPSFRDFLLNNERCTDPNFWVDEKQTHAKLAESCIKLMSGSLKQDICGMDTPGVSVTEVESSRIEQCLPPELQYACLYWVQHLQQGGSVLCDEGQVHQFLKRHLLHWLEALSWMRRLSDGISAVTSLQSVVKNHGCPQLSEYIHDMRRFVLYHRSVIEHAPLQTYCSALVFSPTMSLIKRQFQSDLPQWLRRLPKVNENWDAALQTLEGHTGGVWDVAFSPDGAILASGSSNHMIRLWDAATGTARSTLEGHTNWVNAVAFSPDGAVLASASDDHTVRLWDAATGTARSTLESHTDEVNAVAFSPDGAVLASASDDHTVRLWDAATGTARQTLKTEAIVTQLSFSIDGAVLRTNRGSLPLENASAAMPPALQHVSNHVFIEKQWVIWQKKRMLWLPPDHRPHCSAISGNVLALGYKFGRVSIVEFAFSD